MSKTSKFNKGDVVRYAHAWCGDGERHYLFIILEVYDYTDTFGEFRYGISCINSPLILGHDEIVSEQMIERYL